MCQTFPSVPSLRAICEFLLFLLYIIIIIHYRLVIRSSLVIRLMLLMSSLLTMISTFYQLVEMTHGWLMCVSVYSTTVHYACSAWSKKSASWIREFCVCVCVVINFVIPKLFGIIIPRICYLLFLYYLL